MTSSLKLAAVAMPFLLAESSIQGVKSGALGEWLVQAAAAAVLIMAVWNLVDRMRGGMPQKREVSFTANFVTQAEHAKLEAEVKKIDHERRTSVAELHKKIESVVGKLNERVDAVPERTIKLLRETKDLI